MQVLHQTLLPSSSIHHALSLPHFTPSTIYPIPQPASSSSLGFQVKVVGNLVVAGGSGLRVFEVREELEILGQGGRREEEGRELGEEMEVDLDGFKSMGEVLKSSTSTPPTRLKLHLLASHTLHGTVTGLAAIRTRNSVVDGLDRLIVSLKDAKMAILEWSQGGIQTVSLHTFERCPQVMLGDLEGYKPILRSDPGSRLAALSLPSDGLALLPIVQDLSELEEEGEGSSREIPYTPSFVIPISDLSPTATNLKDFLFLTGFNTPTICLLFSPLPSAPARLASLRDTYCLEIRTIDPVSKTYAGLTSVKGLPGDSLYLAACPGGVGGVLVITETGVIHVDQAGRLVVLSLNGWFTLVTGLGGVDRTSESAKLELDGSRIVWVSEFDALLLLKHGKTRQIAVEMDGRSVTRLVLREEECGDVPIPAAVVRVGDGVFVGSAVGDSVVSQVRMKAIEAAEGTGDQSGGGRMEVELDEDLYGDSATIDDLTTSKPDDHTGPHQATLEICDTLSGIGFIGDMVFGAAEVEGDFVPELVAVSGGGGPSTLNVFRQGLPARKRRRLDVLEETQGVWAMEVAEGGGVEGKVEVVVTTGTTSTEIFSVAPTGDLTLCRIIESKTLLVAPFFSSSSFIRLSPRSISVHTPAGVDAQVIEVPESESAIVGGSVEAPYVLVRRENGEVNLYRGDLGTGELAEVVVPSDGPETTYMAATLFSDTSGIFRTFEATTGKSMAPTTVYTGQSGAQAIQELTTDQLERLQALKPTISMSFAEGIESAVDQGRGSQWLCVLRSTGRLEILALPEMEVVFSAEGLLDGTGALVDQGEAEAAVETMKVDGDEDEEEIDSLVLAPVGSDSPRPHLVATYKSGKLLAYEAQPRFTLESSGQNQRRSLAVRFSKVLTRTLARAKLPRVLVPFLGLAGRSGLFLTGSAPLWILGNDAHSVHAVPALDPVHTFAMMRLPGVSEGFFMHTAKGPNIYEAEPDVCLDFVMACKRVKMERSYTHIVYDPHSESYIGAAAITVPYQIYSDECMIIEDRQGPNLTPSNMERSTIEIFAPDTWLPCAGYEFDENEVVLCMQSMPLECPGDPSGFRNMLVVGTSVNRAEDMVTKGNTYVFEVPELVPGPPGESPRSLRLLVKEDAVAPVTAIGNVSGYLIQAMGQKIYIKALDLEERIVPVAFMDVGAYVTSIGVMKNLILLGDLVKSVWFCAFQETPFKFELLGRDYQDSSVVTADFISAEGKVGLVMTDTVGDLRILEYDAAHPNSLSGERLLRKTEYHTGSSITKSLSIARRKGADEMPQVQLLFSNEDGSISTLTPSKPARAKRLLLLSNLLHRLLPPVAGLNPRAHRTIHNPLYARPLTKGILDGDLLKGFVDLGKARQEEIVEPLGSGTGRETILNDVEDLSGFW